MPSLSLTENAYGQIGIDIRAHIDLKVISEALSDALGTNFSYDVLDFSQADYFNLIKNTIPNLDLSAGISVSADADTEDTLIVGTIFAPDDLDDPNDDNVGPYKVSGFDTLKFTNVSMNNFNLSDTDPLASEAIAIQSGDNARFEGLETGTSLFIDEHADVFDFSMVDGKALHILAPGDGDLEIIAGGENDYFNAGPANSILRGGDGSDLIRGRAGDDRVYGDNGNDDLRGGKGKDLLWGGEGADILRADTRGEQAEFDPETEFDPDATDAENLDKLYTTIWSESYGGLGNDHLYAGDLRDDLIGDVEDNGKFAGELGRDRFYFVKDYHTFYNPSAATTLEAHDDKGGTWTSDDSTVVAKGWDTVHDFASGSDLLVFAVRDDALDDGLVGSRPEIAIELHEDDSYVEYELSGTVIREDKDDYPPYDIGIKFEDATEEIGVADILIQLDQTTAQYKQDLGVTLDENGIGLTGSYEITFQKDTSPFNGPRPGDASKSMGEEHDTFVSLQLERTPFTEGSLSGQDKINLTHFGFSGDEVEDILFTDMRQEGQVDFTLDTMLENKENTFENFFVFDERDPNNPDDDIDRAIHVEYNSSVANGDSDSAEYLELMVYVDANQDGDYSIKNDLVFLLEDPLKGTGKFYNPDPDLDGDLTSSDLYDPDAGTGIFILTEDQYNMWYS